LIRSPLLNASLPHSVPARRRAQVASGSSEWPRRNCSTKALAAHLPLILRHVIETAGQGGVDAGEGDGRNAGDDLVGRHAPVLMPRDGILYVDAVTRDGTNRFSTAWQTAGPPAPHRLASALRTMAGSFAMTVRYARAAESG
jgi:hypothetical protein